MNQLSQIGFGTNIQVCAGYAQATGDRLGPVDFVIHNTGNNALTLQLREHDGTTSPSGYKNVVGVSAFTTIVAGGVATLHTTLLGKQVGFFGSGSTTANISPVLRNKADLRGAQIDIVPLGRRGFGWDDAFDKGAFRAPGWGPAPDAPSNPIP